VAAVLPDGRTSFQALQNVFAGQDRSSLVYFVFDLLRLKGESLEARPLEERKSRLAALLAPFGGGGCILYSDHVAGRGDEFFRRACAHRLEGIVSKRRDGTHRAGRSSEWLKTKCVHRQEFVVGGFTDPAGSRAGLGALLIGYYDSGRRLIFA